MMRSCSDACPLECQTKSFDVNTNSIRFYDSILQMNFFYLNNKYTELTQSVKTTETDLISNAGGTLGLFLDFTFLC